MEELTRLAAVEGSSRAPRQDTELFLRLIKSQKLADLRRHLAQAHRIDIVALSFSAAFNDKQAAMGLAELRAMLPAQIHIWAGGACIERMRRVIDGVDLNGGLAPPVDKVKAWRMLHASA